MSRAGTVLASAGLALMAYRTVSLALQGERSDSQLVTSPLFLVAAACIAVGVLLIGLWILRRGPFPKWVAGLIAGCTCLALVLSLLRTGPLIQSGANIVLAVTLAETAVLAMGRRR
jgi:Na+/proline symporter